MENNFYRVRCCDETVEPTNRTRTGFRISRTGGIYYRRRVRGTHRKTRDRIENNTTRETIGNEQE